MVKEYSVGYKFKGDASGFKRTMSDMNRSVGSIKSSFSGLIGTLGKIGATIGATFALGVLSRFTKGAITAALKTGDLSRQGLETAASMSRITQSIDDIKTSIGKVIVESKFWHFWSTRLENTLTKVKGLFKDTEGFQIHAGSISDFASTTKESIKDLGENLSKTDIGNLVSKIKEGAKESEAMAKAWAIIHKEIAGSDIKPIEIGQYFTGVQGRLAGNFNAPSTEGLRGAPAQVNELTGSLQDQMELVGELTATFQDMFSSIDQGVEGMIDSLISNIKRLATELIAKAVVFSLIWKLFPGMGINLSGGGGFMEGLKNFTGLGNILPSGVSSGKSQMKVQIEGVTRGPDIFWSAKRYGNVLAGNT